MAIPNGASIARNSNNVIYLVRGRFDLPTPIGDTGQPHDLLLEQVRTLLFGMSHDLGLDALGTNFAVLHDAQSAIGRHISMTQTIDGVPVFATHIRVQVDGGKVVQVRVSRYLDRPAQNVPVDDHDSTELSSEAILRVVKQAVGDEPATSQGSPIRVYYPCNDAELRLCYCVELATLTADCRYIVDAYSGQIYAKENIRVSVDATGRVYDPNPVVVANDNSLEEGVTPEAKLNSLMDSRTLKDVTRKGGKFTLKGPYCTIVNKRKPPIPPPQENDPKFAYDRQDNDFEAVNVYYHIDSLQRYIQQTLGITNVLNWSINADHHTEGGAFYSPSDKYLGFGDSGPTRPDRGEDGDVVAHEYGHAIQHDIVPGWGGINGATKRNEARAMGEGFGDILACVYYYETGGIFQPEVFEDWIFGADPPPGASHTGPGMRRVDGSKAYPGEKTTGARGDWVRHSFHANGEIWSATLWDAFIALGGSSSTAATRANVRKDFLRTLILHHFKLTGSDTMPDAAEAILETNTEDPEIRGRQIMELVNVFHDRNILVSEPGVDLWLKDRVSDVGSESVSGKFWDSPDLWVRNHEDDVEGHQTPKFGQDNWFYARVRNRGTETARAFVVTFESKLWQGTQFMYKDDFVPYISAAVGFNLAPGASTVVKARWPKDDVPSVGSHGCLLVSAYCPADEADTGKRVWEDNNLAQKNLTVVALKPAESADVPVRLGNIHNSGTDIHRIEVTRPIGRESLSISLFHPDRRLTSKLFRTTSETASDPATSASDTQWPEVASRRPALTVLESTRVRLTTSTGVRNDDNYGMEMYLQAGSKIVSTEQPPTRHSGDRHSTGGEAFFNIQADLIEAGADGSPTLIAMHPGRSAGFPIVLRSRFAPQLKIRITAPSDATSGEEYTIDVMQRNRDGSAVGGITVLVQVQ